MKKAPDVSSASGAPQGRFPSCRGVINTPVPVSQPVLRTRGRLRAPIRDVYVHLSGGWRHDLNGRRVIEHDHGFSDPQNGSRRPKQREAKVKRRRLTPDYAALPQVSFTGTVRKRSSGWP
jgi:hypothetical protein